jgi:3-methyl-2-oxobutanoate hydroxymethyltransferase
MMAKITRLDLLRSKQDHRRLVVVTAYDFSAARLVDRAGVDAILVGDSLGNVIQGHESTRPAARHGRGRPSLWELSAWG